MPVKRKTVPVKRPAAAKCVVRVKKAPVTKTLASKTAPAKKKTAAPTGIEKHVRHRPSHIRSAVDRLNDPPSVPLPALLKRVSSAIERELTQIEIIICGSHVPPRFRTEAERRARTLASLARTLREVMLLREKDEKNREDDDTVPRDLDELRRQLAQRLDGLVADAKAACPGEAE
jgi:hypothetical protein